MKYLDILRTLYVKIPWRARELLSIPASLLPPSLRYGPRYASTLARLRHFSSLDAPAASQSVLAALHKQLVLAASLPFYRDKWAPVLRTPASIPPRHDELLDFYTALPELTRHEVHTAGDRLLACPRATVSKVRTSGSTGSPVTFYLDADRSPVEWAFIHTFWQRAGFRLTSWRASIRGNFPPPSPRRPWRIDRALREVTFPASRAHPDLLLRFARFVAKRQIPYLHGYPSSLAYFCSICRSNNITLSFVRGILPISEPITPDHRAIFSATCPRAVVLSYYGLSEKVAIAEEMRPDEYVFHSLYGFTHPGSWNPHSPPQLGSRIQIVSTGLLFRCFPLVKYQTGDSAVLVDAPHFGNGFRMQVSRIMSDRGGMMLYGLNGEKVSLPALNHYACFDHIGQIQYLQDSPGSVIVHIVPVANKSFETRKLLERELQKSLGPAFRVEVRVVSSIEAGGRGKRKLVVRRFGDDKL